MHTVVAERGVPLCPVCASCGASLPFGDCPHDHPDTGDPCLTDLRPSLAPGSVEAVIASNYMAYPTLFGRRAWGRLKILDHLFFVIGTGCEWVGGRIVEPDSTRPGWRAPERELAWAREQDARIGLPLASLASVYLTLEERMAAHEASRQGQAWVGPDDAELERRIQARWEAERTGLPPYLYDLGLRSNLLDLPDDILPDWLGAAWDAYALLMLVPDTYRDGERGLDRWKAQARWGDTLPPITHRSNLGNAPRVLARLRALTAPDLGHEARVRAIVEQHGGTW